MAISDEGVRLVDPTDFEILRAMSDGERYTGQLLGHLLERDRQYMNNRLAYLRSYGLIVRVEGSSMYAITEKGYAAIELQDEYSHDISEEFDEMVAELAQEMTHDRPCNHLDESEA